MALAGYRLLPSLQLLYSQLTQVSSMRHAVDEVYDEFVAAETDKCLGYDCRRHRSGYRSTDRMPSEALDLD